MKQMFKNYYRVESTRLKNWDYSSDGIYFITICTKNRIHYFGEIKNGKMILNKIGKIVKNEYVKTAFIRKNIILDEYVIMPNHVHGIIKINNIGVETHCNASRNGINPHCMDDASRNDINPHCMDDASRNGIDPHCMDDAHCMDIGVETHCNASLHGDQYKNKFGPQINNLSSIIRGFKGATTKQIRKINSNFTWQPRFYDHIIRNIKSLNNFQQYIIYNPKNWWKNKNNCSNLYM